MIYWYAPEILMIPMSGLLVVSLITLLLNGKKFELPFGFKQQFLILALTSALLTLTFLGELVVN